MLSKPVQPQIIFIKELNSKFTCLLLNNQLLDTKIYKQFNILQMIKHLFYRGKKY